MFNLKEIRIIEKIDLHEISIKFNNEKERDKFYEKIIELVNKQRIKNSENKWIEFNGIYQIQYYDVITKYGEFYSKCWPVNKQFWPSDRLNLSIHFNDVDKIKKYN